MVVSERPGREPLPIDAALAGVQASLSAAPVLLLIAPPGSGKTTRVPPALLSLITGPRAEVVVLEPRRLAARAAAARVAAELGTRVGDRVGYQVRGDRRVSAATRIRFVTEGVLVRQLVQDPFLDGVGAVVLDEFHERHVEGDLALAMLAEARATVRQDLLLCVMSATLDPAPLLAFLPGARVLSADGRLFPVRVVHLGRSAAQPLELAVRDAVVRALTETAGDVLVFLPGTAEIARAANALEVVAERQGVLLLPLHGRLEPAAQDRAIRPAAQRKVVLSTNVAESSLTIPGVTAVVDSGLARELRFEPGRGVDVLQLERIALASADQRAGRAGRTGPGVCYRLWSQLDERGLPATAIPEIQRIDLAGPALLVRAFAGREPQEFGWFESPSRERLRAADQLLAELGALQPNGAGLSRFGAELLGLPLHPRLGAVVQHGTKLGCAVAATTAAALLAELDQLGRGDGADLLAVTDTFLQAEARGFPDGPCRELGAPSGLLRQVAAARDRLLGALGAPTVDAAPERLPRALLAGFPDRVALRASGGEPRAATMVGGRGLWLPQAVDGHDLVLALRLLETGRQQRSRVVLAAPLAFADLAALGPAALQHVPAPQVDAELGRVTAARELRYRDLVLQRARGGELPPGAAAALLEPLLAADPWRWLGAADGLRRWLARCAWLRERNPELGLPACDNQAVAAAAVALLGDRTDLRDLAADEVVPWLEATWTPLQRRALREQAPERIELPSGRAAVVDYAAPAGPTIRARLQEFFGLPEVGRLAGGRVPVVLELLAPNHQPVQVTTDLASFWRNVYPGVRRELARRYPRHSWPEDPLAANPEARPARRRRE